MNRRSMILVTVLMLFFSSCDGQQKKQAVSTVQSNCNRTVYGGPQYIKLLPPYICIPAGFVIDDYVRVSDLGKDGKINFLAVKYNKKEDDQIDGDLTYWAFYERSKSADIFSLKTTLSNIVPPYIEDISYEYLLAHPVAEKLFKSYPLRLSHSLSFQVDTDTIRLSYKFDDSYGKSFVFTYKQNNWYLENVEYFFGELPMYWWKDDDFFYSLNEKLKVIETRKPQKRVSISDFDLKVAFKYREEEQNHLAEWHIDTIDKTKWKSIDDVVFTRCHGMDLPEDWLY